MKEIETKGANLKANPNEREKQSEGGENKAVELEAPSEGGDPWAAQLDLQTLLLTLAPPWRRLVGVGVLHPWAAQPLLPVNTHFTLLDLWNFLLQLSMFPRMRFLGREGFIISACNPFCSKFCSLVLPLPYCSYYLVAVLT